MFSVKKKKKSEIFKLIILQLKYKFSFLVAFCSLSLKDGLKGLSCTFAAAEFSLVIRLGGLEIHLSIVKCM